MSTTDGRSCPSLPWQIYYRRWLAGCFVLLGVGTLYGDLTLLRAAFITPGFTTSGTELLGKLCSSSIALGGVCFILVFLPMFLSGKPQVVVSEEGIYYRRWPWATIPWSRIADVGLTKANSLYTTVDLWFDVVDVEDLLNQYGRKSRFSNRMLRYVRGGTPIFIPMGMLAVKPQLLVDTIKPRKSDAAVTGKTA